MSEQHAQAFIADLYDYSRPNWSTPASRYAKRYLDFKLGRCKKPPKEFMPNMDEGATSARIRDRLERELSRP